MVDITIDVRTVPPGDRHPTVHDAFAALKSGETLTLINDYEPRPLFYEMQGNVPAFDADGYTVDRHGDEKFVVTFPKK